MATDTKMRTRPPRPLKHKRVSSLRSFHKEPYPPTSPSSDVDPRPLGGLLPSPSTFSPTRRHANESSVFVPPAETSATSGVSSTSVTAMLVPLFCYFSLNLLLTLYNKIVLVRFPFPYTLTAFHALAGTLGANLLVHYPFLALRVSQTLQRPIPSLPPFFARYTWRLRRLWLQMSDRFGGVREHRPMTAPASAPGLESYRLGESEVADSFYTSTHSGMRSHPGSSPTHRQPFSERSTDTHPSVGPPHVPREILKPSSFDLTPKETLVIVAFSILYTINIVVSNMSLGLVTVPFHQVVRSSAPFFTIALSAGFLGQHASKAKIISLIPVIAGVGFATYGDYYFTRWGFALTLLGTLLAALKTVITHFIQSSGRFIRSSAPKHDGETLASSARSLVVGAIHTPIRTDPPWTRNPDGLSEISSSEHTHRHNLTLSDLFPRSPSHSPASSIAQHSSNDSILSIPLSISISNLGSMSTANSISPEAFQRSVHNMYLGDDGLHSSHSFQSSSSASSIFDPPSPSPSSRNMPTSPLANVATLASTAFSPTNGGASVPSVLGVSQSPTQTHSLQSSDSPSSLPPSSVGLEVEDRSDLQAFRFPRAVMPPPPPYSITDVSNGSTGLASSSTYRQSSDIVGELNMAGASYPLSSSLSAASVSSIGTNGNLPLSISFPDSGVSKCMTATAPAGGQVVSGHNGLLRPMSPLDLLLLTSPLAFIQCVLIAHFSGELDNVRHYSQHEMSNTKLMALLVNGLIAFGLNVVSFTANKKIGALGMSVAANVKQVLTILIAVVIFELRISGTNAIGILLTLFGGAWYARVEYAEKTRRSG
ncbi:TPT-domain-containing protein [Pleurotus eryngii]|uniref:TPT-domain-containing protein n=1 Tax=Pleurotus eryngii TaxID=5323 RepID=A0A9P5ZWA6_PLEER|nr:TPT-domain-containing protein [Pleurotus eryngii]